MRRPLVLIAVAVAAAACGISVVGTDVAPIAFDAGVEASTSSAPIADAATPDDAARPDARPLDRGDCTLLVCNDAGGCLDESCGTGAPAGRWPDAHIDGGSLDDTSTDCTSSTAVAGQTAFKSATLPSAARYQYDLRFQLTTHDDTKATIAEIATGTTTAIRVTVEQKQLRVCNAQGNCTAPHALTDGIDIHVYGRMGTDERFGSAILEIGRTDCTEIATLDLDGPFPGTRVTASVGCLGDAPCYLYWDDARMTVRPY